MPAKKSLDPGVTTIPFDKFWRWLQSHPNCIVRAGTPETVIYDDTDVHWHFTSEGGDTVVVQAMRGKRVAAELLIVPTEVDYVQGEAGEEEEEYVFELISETEADRVAAYHFVLSHGFEAEEDTSGPGPGRAVH